MLVHLAGAASFSPPSISLSLPPFLSLSRCIQCSVCACAFFFPSTLAHCLSAVAAQRCSWMRLRITIATGEDGCIVGWLLSNPHRGGGKTEHSLRLFQLLLQEQSARLRASAGKRPGGKDGRRILAAPPTDPRQTETSSGFQPLKGDNCPRDSPGYSPASSPPGTHLLWIFQLRLVFCGHFDWPRPLLLLLLLSFRSSVVECSLCTDEDRLPGCLLQYQRTARPDRRTLSGQPGEI